MANLGQMFPDIFGDNRKKKTFKKYGPKAGSMAKTINKKPKDVRK